MYTQEFLQLAQIYRSQTIAFPDLKAVTLAQWILESGRGNSNLATLHRNFGGLKWRTEMQGYATPVDIVVSDGLDTYCRFGSLEEFIRGYWKFMSRSPYEGYEAFGNSPAGYIHFVGPIYAPVHPGYADDILSLVPEANELLGLSENEPIDDLEKQAGTIVIDPGHGGSVEIGGSSPNNTTSASGIKEKTLALQFSEGIKVAILERAPLFDINPTVKLTRTSDINLSLEDRAKVAKDNQADVFFSVHFNGGIPNATHGPETYILRRAQNVNFDEDAALAKSIQDNMFEVLKRHNPTTTERTFGRGYKEAGFGTLSDVSLGNSQSNHKTRAAYLEIEFIDLEPVDEILISGPNASQVQQELFDAIADGVLSNIAANRSSPLLDLPKLELFTMNAP